MLRAATAPDPAILADPPRRALNPRWVPRNPKWLDTSLSIWWGGEQREWHQNGISPIFRWLSRALWACCCWLPSSRGCAACLLGRRPSLAWHEPTALAHRPALGTSGEFRLVRVRMASAPRPDACRNRGVPDYVRPALRIRTRPPLRAELGAFLAPACTMCLPRLRMYSICNREKRTGGASDATASRVDRDRKPLAPLAR
jgi:hypothetical protein